MKKHFLLLSVFIGCILTSCQDTNILRNVDPILGEYKIEGWNPGNDFNRPCNYTGNATIEKRGDSYYYSEDVIMNGKAIKYNGPCAFHAKDNAFSLTWNGSDKTEGINIFTQTQTGFSVDWAQPTDTGIDYGKEIWTKEPLAKL